MTTVLAALVAVLHSFYLFLLDKLIHYGLIVNYQFLLLGLNFLWNVFCNFAKIEIELLLHFYLCLLDVINVNKVNLLLLGRLELHLLLFFHFLDHF